jgi:hypothetical protein
LIGDKLNQEEIPQKDRSPHQQSRRSRSPHDEAPQPRRSRSPRQENHSSQDGDARSIITHAWINRSRYEWDKGNYEDEETEMGASCFTRRVHKTQVPKGFKLPHDQQKYDGSQEPESWLTDYLQAIKILEGSKATAMQSLQLHLTGAARYWLRKLPKESIRNWNELEKQFTSNFRSTYTRPMLIEEAHKKAVSHYARIYNDGA